MLLILLNRKIKVLLVFVSPIVALSLSGVEALDQSVEESFFGELLEIISETDFFGAGGVQFFVLLIFLLGICFLVQRFEDH
jgi:hypothetical protein